MSDPGSYFVYRGVWDHELFENEAYSRREAWLWLIAEAVWKPRAIRIAGKTIELQRGQLAHSIRFLAEKWGWHRCKVERFFACLKTETMVRTETETGITIITICNYDQYQLTPSDAETLSGTENETAARQQRDREESLNKKISMMEGAAAEPKRSRRRQLEVPFPENWLPKGYQPTDSEEFERFRDHALQKDRRCVDWNAAWRNWLRSPYRKKEVTNGSHRDPRPYGGSVAAAAADWQRRLAAGESTADILSLSPRGLPKPGWVHGAAGREPAALPNGSGGARHQPDVGNPDQIQVPTVIGGNSRGT